MSDESPAELTPKDQTAPSQGGAWTILSALFSGKNAKLATGVIHAKRSTGSRKVASAEKIEERLGHLRHSVLLGVVTLLAGIALHYMSEHTTTGRDLRLGAYEHLMGVIPTPASPDPVYVVDIGRAFDLPQHEGHIDADKVADLIQALADQGPAAIAVDIDFGAFDPDDVLKLGSETSDFPDYNGKIVKTASALKTKVPVFLAVSRNLLGQESAWLPDNLGGEHSDSVVAPVVPMMKGDQIIVPETVEVPSGRNVPSIGFALARAYREHHKLKPIAAPFGTEQYVSDLSEDLVPEIRELFEHKGRSTLILLNPGVVEAIRNARIPVSSPADVAPGHGEHLLPADGIEGKVVVIGTTLNEAGDRWFRSKSDLPEAGVFLHAAAAYTLIKAPLYELMPWTDWFLTLGLSLLTLFIPVTLRLKRIGDEHETDHERLHSWATIGIVAGAFALGWIFAYFNHIVWFGFLLATVALAAHPSLEKGIHRLLRRTGILKEPTEAMAPEAT